MSSNISRGNAGQAVAKVKVEPGRPSYEPPAKKPRPETKQEIEDALVQRLFNKERVLPPEFHKLNQEIEEKLAKTKSCSKSMRVNCGLLELDGCPAFNNRVKQRAKRIETLRTKILASFEEAYQKTMVDLDRALAAKQAAQGAGQGSGGRATATVDLDRALAAKQAAKGAGKGSGSRATATAPGALQEDALSSAASTASFPSKRTTPLSQPPATRPVKREPGSESLAGGSSKMTTTTASTRIKQEATSTKTKPEKKE